MVGTAVIGTVAIAAGAFWLSFASLSNLARRAGIAPSRAWVWPLIVDGVIVVATVSVVALGGQGRRAARYPWTLLAAGAVVSVAANVSHALLAADPTVPPVIAAAVAAVPPVVLLAITHLTVELTRKPTGEPARATKSAPSMRGRRVSRRAKRVDGQPTGTSGAAAEAVRLRAQESWSNRAIAAHLGVHPSTVGRWFSAYSAAEPPDVTASSADVNDTAAQDRSR